MLSKDKKKFKKGMSIYDELMAHVPDSIDDERSKQILVVKKLKKKEE
jgi:hypothetical protein